MPAFSQPLAGERSGVPAAEQMRRKPQRLSITVSSSALEAASKAKTLALLGKS